MRGRRIDKQHVLAAELGSVRAANINAKRAQGFMHKVATSKCNNAIRNTDICVTDRRYAVALAGLLQGNAIAGKLFIRAERVGDARTKWLSQRGLNLNLSQFERLRRNHGQATACGKNSWQYQGFSLAFLQLLHLL